MFGLLGALSSCSTAHFAVPLPVCVAVHPGGGAPVWRLSKFTVSATAGVTSTAVISTAGAIVIEFSVLYMIQRHSEVKGRSFAGFTLDLNRASMNIQNPFRNR